VTATSTPQPLRQRNLTPPPVPPSASVTPPALARRLHTSTGRWRALDPTFLSGAGAPSHRCSRLPLVHVHLCVKAARRTATKRLLICMLFFTKCMLTGVHVSSNALTVRIVQQGVCLHVSLHAGFAYVTLPGAPRMLGLVGSVVLWSVGSSGVALNGSAVSSVGASDVSGAVRRHRGVRMFGSRSAVPYRIPGRPAVRFPSRYKPGTFPCRGLHVMLRSAGRGSDYGERNVERFGWRSGTGQSGALRRRVSWRLAAGRVADQRSCVPPGQKHASTGRRRFSSRRRGRL